MTGTIETHPVRSWLGIPFSTAERFRSPVLIPYDPDLPYDEKGPAPSKPALPPGSRPTTDSAKTA
ncbi:hypothetical protein [Rhodococcus sp. 24CO]|uniref:hypothetical protein n=1 Tax=Rhodococcus sp. 24CO TaxID=3117460 RepID=UPI003D33FC26